METKCLKDLELQKSEEIKKNLLIKIMQIHSIVEIEKDHKKDQLSEWHCLLSNFYQTLIDFETR